MAAAAILDFQFMWIWPLWRVGSVVFVFCTKFGSNICYSHWDRRTYASDLHLMTSRKLTSGFNFWSRGHLCMALVRLPMKFGADIFIQSGVIDIFFRNSIWRPPPSWICLGEPWDHPRSLIHGAYLVWKFCHDRLSSFQVIRIWIFSRSGLKVLFAPQNFSFLGILPLKFRGTSFRPTKGTSLSGTTRFEPSLVQIGRTDCTVRPVAFPKKPKKRKKDSGKLAIRPDHPRRRIEVKVCMPGGLRCVVLYISSFIKIGPVVLPLWVVENRPSPLLWPLAYTTACTTVQAVISLHLSVCLARHKVWCLRRQETQLSLTNRASAAHTK